MKSKSFLLLGTLLKSTSSVNAIRHSGDKKRKNKLIGTIAGQIAIELMLIVYVGLTAVGIGMSGMAAALPALTADIICIMSFFLAIFKTNGYMFAFKEYDMLMSMPFPVGTIVSAKFMYMYINTLSWVMTLSVSVMAVYGYFVRPSVVAYVLWILLTLVIPLIPVVLAALLGTLIAGIGAGFRHKKAIQIILTFIIVMPCFFLQYILQSVFENSQIAEVMAKVVNVTNGGTTFFPPVKWFEDAVTDYSISSILLLVGVSLAVYSLFVFAVEKKYRQINSKLMASHKHKNRGNIKYAKKNIVVSIAFKELRRMFGSTTYAVNAGMGFVLAAIFGTAALFVSGDTIVSVVLKGAPVDPSIIIPAIPLLIYFFIGMVATTCCSPSLEGKNYWIIKTMPIDNMTVFKGKMLFNFLLEAPIGVYATLCLCISFRAGILMTLLSLVLIILLACFSTLWGLVCGVRHIKFNWENEIEVVKQSAAVSIYLLPNMFGVMILVGVSIYLVPKMGAELFILAVIAFVAVLTAALYTAVKRLAQKNI